MSAERPDGRARIVIADDHELTRIGLRGMLADERDMEVIGEARDGFEAVELCRQLKPRLALLDVRMPGLDGIAATRSIRRESPQTSILIVTLYDSTDYIMEALRAGASGYLLKDARREALLAAVRSLLRGETSVTAEMFARLAARSAPEEPGSGQPIDRLTPREAQVLRLVARGWTNREIGQTLTISPGTVKIHVEHILAKLGVADRTQAAVRAIQLGVLSEG